MGPTTAAVGTGGNPAHHGGTSGGVAGGMTKPWKQHPAKTWCKSNWRAVAGTSAALSVAGLGYFVFRRGWCPFSTTCCCGCGPAGPTRDDEALGREIMQKLPAQARVLLDRLPADIVKGLLGFFRHHARYIGINGDLQEVFVKLFELVHFVKQMDAYEKADTVEERNDRFPDGKPIPPRISEDVAAVLARTEHVEKGVSQAVKYMDNILLRGAVELIPGVGKVYGAVVDFLKIFSGLSKFVSLL